MIPPRKGESSARVYKVDVGAVPKSRNVYRNIDRVVERVALSASTCAYKQNKISDYKQNKIWRRLGAVPGSLNAIKPQTIRRTVCVTSTARCIFLSVLGSLLAAASYTARASSLPAGFADTLVNRPDGRPWDNAGGVAFAEDGRMFVWERTGRVWLLGDAPMASEPLVNLSDEVSSIGALGLTGLALDSQFARNGFFYLFYAVDAQHLANCDAPAVRRCDLPHHLPGGPVRLGERDDRAPGPLSTRPTRLGDHGLLTPRPSWYHASRANPSGAGPRVSTTGPTGCVVTDQALSRALAHSRSAAMERSFSVAATVQVRALGNDPRTVELYYISGSLGSEVHKLMPSRLRTSATVTHRGAEPRCQAPQLTAALPSPNRRPAGTHPCPRERSQACSLR